MIYKESLHLVGADYGVFREDGLGAYELNS